ncbi:MAG: M48 family metallopeptidase [Kiritimatiellia bacterium]
MDFFESQERARRKTGLLVFYYGLAVALIITSVYLAFALLFASGGESAAGPESSDIPSAALWDPALFLMVAGGTLLVVLGGTAYKVASLARGGKSVAQLLGGRLLHRDTGDQNERKLLNVVEEMAIASGLPVPPVYLLDQEPGINAFAAGFTPEDAVIGVTRGLAEQLTRDEIQGVIAHEFSHVAHGDMRLNIRLMGVLHGILMIGLIGYWLMRSSMLAGGGRGRSGSRGKGNSQSQMALLGLAVAAIGFVGVFFGKLIKSAVSRQREFLADASAVQFTRNPAGIAGALRKIAEDSGSRLNNLHAEEASHLFFGNGVGNAFISLMSTHPPLRERIRRIDPEFLQNQSDKTIGTPAVPPAPVAENKTAAGVMPAAIMAAVGSPNARHLHYAVDTLATLPDQLRAAARNRDGAQAVVFGLLLHADPPMRERQIESICQLPEIASILETMNTSLAKLPLELRLPLADLALGTLKELPAADYEKFKTTVELLIVADESVSLFEYTLHHMIQRHLDGFFHKSVPIAVRHHALAPIANPCVDLLSCLAHWGDFSGTQADDFFQQGMARLQPEARGSLREKKICTVSLLDEALQVLAAADTPLKKKVMDACVHCAAASGTVTANEALMLRAVGDCLGCPIPPVLAG